MKTIFVALQYLLPKTWLTRLVGKLGSSEFTPVKAGFIRLFAAIYKPDMSEAEQSNLGDYRTFNEFFTRPLKAGARPISLETEAIACPADGAISQIGDIEGGALLQAKGKEFSLNHLLGGDEFLAQSFLGGKFATIYLSPKDYHRVHMPYDGQLQTMIHVPGTLFSVNNGTTSLVNNLFARNERVVSVFDTDSGPMAIILVGAMIVASIETVWAGQITPPERKIHTTHYPNTTDSTTLTKGQEMGRFLLGSTAIVLFGPDAVEWDEGLMPGAKVKMGEKIGELINA